MRRLTASREILVSSILPQSHCPTLTERGVSPLARREAPPRRRCPIRASADVALGRQRPRRRDRSRHDPAAHDDGTDVPDGARPVHGLTLR